MNSPFVRGFGLAKEKYVLWEGCRTPHPPVRWADVKPLVSTPSGPLKPAEHQAETQMGTKAKQNVQCNYFRLLNLPSTHSKVVPILNNFINLYFRVFRIKLDYK